MSLRYDTFLFLERIQLTAFFTKSRFIMASDFVTLPQLMVSPLHSFACESPAARWNFAEARDSFYATHAGSHRKLALVRCNGSSESGQACSFVRPFVIPNLTDIVLINNSHSRGRRARLTQTGNHTAAESGLADESLLHTHITTTEAQSTNESLL